MVDEDLYICKRCAERYEWQSIEPPENATIYWVPDCPACGAKLTATTVDDTWMEIISTDLDSEHDRYEHHRKRVHFHSRLYHGRLADVSVDDLIELAQHFDDRVSFGKRWGPQKERDVAFALRQQARREL